MKRILLLVCCLTLAFASTAEARWFRRSNNNNYTSYKPTYTTYKPTVAATPAITQTVSATTATTTRPATTQVSYTSASTTRASFSTATAQGVAQIMASRGQVGHWGGNTGYEGCGAGATAAAAYNNCCYANSGMRTVDVGYARSASGMWFCCRRYR
jgi:hypothetical protein